MIIGNLTRDPELRTTATGTNVASFGVATSRKWTNAAGQPQEEVEYHNIVVWGKLADICKQYLGKGRKVFVEGRLRTREWEGQDGAKRRTTEIICENMIMLDRAPQQGDPTFQPRTPQSPASPGARQGGPAAPPTIDVDVPVMSQAPNDEEIKVEDIPF